MGHMFLEYMVIGINRHTVGVPDIRAKNVMVACDFNMMFIHVYAGTPNVVLDSQVLRDVRNLSGSRFLEPTSGTHRC